MGLFGSRQVVLTRKKYAGAKPKPKKGKIPKKLKSIFKKFIFESGKKKNKKKNKIKPIKRKKLKKKAKGKRVKKHIRQKVPRGRRRKMVEERPKEERPEEVEIGMVTHFFPHVNAAVIKLKAALSEGDTVHIKVHTTDFTEQITSMQINNKPIKEAKKGDEVGLLVKEKVRGGDIVYKV